MKNIPYPEKGDLLTKFDDSRFVTAVFNQIAKEFHKIGIALQFEITDLQSYQQFHQCIADELEVIFRSSKQRFNQLLYSIDLPENKVNQIVKHGVEPLKELSELILIRVSQKVYFRMHFDVNKSEK